MVTCLCLMPCTSIPTALWPLCYVIMLLVVRPNTTNYGLLVERVYGYSSRSCTTAHTSQRVSVGLSTKASRAVKFFI